MATPGRWRCPPTATSGAERSTRPPATPRNSTTSSSRSSRRAADSPGPTKRTPRRGLAALAARRQDEFPHPGGVGLALGRLHAGADHGPRRLHLAAPDLVRDVG